MQDDAVRRVLERPQHVTLAAVSVVQHSECVVGVRREHDRVECVSRAALGPHRGRRRGPRDVHDGITGADRLRPEPFQDPLDIRLRAAPDRPPLQRSTDADEAMVVQEAEQVVKRELEDAVGRRRPDR
jgi:hypothetical protein